MVGDKFRYAVISAAVYKYQTAMREFSDSNVARAIAYGYVLGCADSLVELRGAAMEEAATRLRDRGRLDYLPRKG